MEVEAAAAAAQHGRAGDAAGSSAAQCGPCTPASVPHHENGAGHALSGSSFCTLMGEVDGCEPAAGGPAASTAPASDSTRVATTSGLPPEHAQLRQGGTAGVSGRVGLGASVWGMSSWAVQQVAAWGRGLTAAWAGSAAGGAAPAGLEQGASSSGTSSDGARGGGGAGRFSVPRGLAEGGRALRGSVSTELAVSLALALVLYAAYRERQVRHRGGDGGARVLGRVRTGAPRPAGWQPMICCRCGFTSALSCAAGNQRCGAQALQGPEDGRPRLGAHGAVADTERGAVGVVRLARLARGSAAAARNARVYSAERRGKEVQTKASKK